MAWFTRTADVLAVMVSVFAVALTVATVVSLATPDTPRR
jgi:hypothetical protein